MAKWFPIGFCLSLLSPALAWGHGGPPLARHLFEIPIMPYLCGFPDDEARLHGPGGMGRKGMAMGPIIDGASIL